MHVFKVGLIGVALALSGAMSAQAAVLTPITINCGAGGVIGLPNTITGTVGDTVVISPQDVFWCSNVTATPASITGSADINNGTPQTYTLVAAGVGHISLSPTFGANYNIPFTVNAAPVANTTTVPTLSEYAMIALASLMAMGGIWTMRKRGKR